MTKDKLLALLLRHESLSGEAAGRELGVTRAAVSQAVAELRRDGYGIESKTRVGYRLERRPDRVDAPLIAASMKRSRCRIEAHASVGSTNTEAKARAEAGEPELLCVVADGQTGGRGRLGRSFVSEPGKGVYMSILMRPEEPVAALGSATALVALAVCDGLERATGLDPQIKWTNDILLGGRKLAGILTELALEGESGRVRSLVTGIGINARYREEDFPEELRARTVSLGMAGSAAPRAAVIAAVLDAWEDYYREGRIVADLADCRRRYRARCVTLGKRVRVHAASGVREAESLDIADDFALVVRYDDGETEALRSGEVSVRGIDGYA